MKILISSFLFVFLLADGIIAKRCRRTNPDDRYIILDKHITANWHEAGHICGRIGMRLAQVVTQSDMDQLTATLTKWNQIVHPSTYLWLGGSDLASEGEFVWTSNGEPIVSNNWFAGQPDNYENNEHCLMSRMGDSDCSSTIMYARRKSISYVSSFR